jgi:Ca-activated chloride channel family protein
VSLFYFAIALVTAPRRGPIAGATLASATPFALGWLPVHFIRPGWLLALLLAGSFWWLLRRHSDASQAWRGIIAPHLLARLWGGEERRSRFGPLEWIGLTWLVVIVAIAGPTWKHVPSPFAEETAAIAVVVAVTPSMQTEDVQPSRSERATLKLHDLLANRGSARTALIAYAGTAHLVMPTTTDAGIIDAFAQALDPAIMPREGDAAAAALHLADRTLTEAGGGSIVWITDTVAPEQAAELAAWRQQSSTAVRLWPPLLPGAERDALEQNAQPVRPDVVYLTADDGDVRALASAARFADVSGTDADTRWAESGFWLTPLIVLLMLPLFRRGWMVSVARPGRGSSLGARA